MASITALPTEIVQQTCEYLDNQSLFSLRGTCHDIKQKSHYHFAKLFFSVKISFCHVSIQALDTISKDSAIANNIQNLIIGTETLDQFKRTIPERDGAT